MDFKNLFNSYLNHGFLVRINGLIGKDEWNTKISLQDGSQNDILEGWITSRIFYDGTKTNDHNIIYDYLYNKLGIKGEASDISLHNFEQFHFLLQTARIVKNNTSCKVEKLAQIAYNVGQLLASIHLYYDHPSALHYITVNKLNQVESYISLAATPSSATPSSATPSSAISTQIVGGSTTSLLDMYSKYINMTPYKGHKLIGGKSCTCGSEKCSNCNEITHIDLLI
jgi:hypothetical protein